MSDWSHTRKAILRDLAFGPSTSMEVAAALKMERGYIHRRLKELHEEGVVHISGHEISKNNSRVPIYGIGHKRDAKPPPLLDPKEYSRRYQRKHREKVYAARRKWYASDPEVRARYNARWLAWKEANKEAYLARRRELRAAKRQLAAQSKESKWKIALGF